MYHQKWKFYRNENSTNFSLFVVLLKPPSRRSKPLRVKTALPLSLQSFNTVSNDHSIHLLLKNPTITLIFSDTPKWLWNLKSSYPYVLSSGSRGWNWRWWRVFWPRFTAGNYFGFVFCFWVVTVRPWATICVSNDHINQMKTTVPKRFVNQMLKLCYTHCVDWESMQNQESAKGIE